ncbi:MAG: peptide ABC transporter ATP-binding protein, partial [Firmicutes bacterium]|nr:peptide ABC transporter ATP-binding protein [Bacillota bacterium]
PYTKALLSAVPIPEIGAKKERKVIKGELTSPINPGDECRFAKRCPFATEECFHKTPALEEIIPGHFVACHHVREINDIKE